MQDKCYWRSLFCAIILITAFTGLCSRLVILHLVFPSSVGNKLGENRKIEKKILAERGVIYDRNDTKNVLAINLPVKDVWADPSIIAKSNCLLETTSVLAEQLDISADEIAVKLSRSNRRFVWIKRFVPEEISETIRRQNVKGVFFNDNIIRYYPMGTALCHVLGFVNYEGIGSSGIEQFADKYLRGIPGFMESQVDAKRREIVWKRNRYVPALQGANVFLTIDQNIQHFAETEIDRVVREHSAKGACIIVQKIKTGEIIAIANRPSFNPNEFNVADENAKLNRAIGMVFEPGSVFKAIVFSSALSEKTVRPDMVIDCENGQWAYGGKILRDYHPYERLTVADGIKKSSNILSAKVALTLGNKRFYNYLKAFKIGEKLGVDLPGEEKGLLSPVEEWSVISPTRIAIGQGVAVTPLQMLSVYNAIANDGVMMKPYVIDKIVTADGELLYKACPQIIANPIKSEVARQMKQLLVRVTEEGGTGRKAAIDGYEIAGKTGSAQKAINGVYSSTAHVATFVGFLPAANPEIAVIVVVDEPHPFHTGGVVAAPVFKRVSEQIVRYMDIPPSGHLLANLNDNRN